MKLYSAIYDFYHPFDQMSMFDSHHHISDPEEMDESGMLIVHGGSDISPALYNKGRSSRTQAGNKPSRRDTVEWNLMAAAVKKHIPVMGICRGAQMLCAMAGGFLVQDVEAHIGTHPVQTRDGKKFETNSIHHQMMYPFDVEHEMIATTTRKLSEYYMSEEDKCIDVPVEPEFVYFPKLLGIAVQWHPEMMEADTPANDYLLSFILKVFK